MNYQEAKEKLLSDGFTILCDDDSYLSAYYIYDETNQVSLASFSKYRRSDISYVVLFKEALEIVMKSFVK